MKLNQLPIDDFRLFIKVKSFVDRLNDGEIEGFNVEKTNWNLFLEINKKLSESIYLNNFVLKSDTLLSCINISLNKDLLLGYRALSFKGLTIPQFIVRELTNDNQLYLLPIDNSTFLINNFEGNHPTSPIRSYQDGRFVIPKSKINTLLGREINVGDGFEFKRNGSTHRSIKCSVIN